MELFFLFYLFYYNCQNWNVTLKMGKIAFCQVIIKSINLFINLSLYIKRAQCFRGINLFRLETVQLINTLTFVRLLSCCLIDNFKELWCKKSRIWLVQLQPQHFKLTNQNPWIWKEKINLYFYASVKSDRMSSNVKKFFIFLRLIEL